MPNFNLLDGEVEALVAYMSSLGGGNLHGRRPQTLRGKLRHLPVSSTG